MGVRPSRRAARRLALRLIPAMAGLAAAGAAFGQVMIGNWVVTEHRDGDSGVHPTALLGADDGADLVASCDGSGLNLFVSYVEPLRAGQTVEVRWKTDRTPWRRQAWSVGPDRGTIFSAPAEPSRRLLAELAGAHVLSIQVAGRRSSFPLQGVRQVADLLGACKGA